MSARATSPTLQIRRLLGAESFPHSVAGLRLIETHISWIILTGPFAYKIKKPVKLDFIDASTLERRLHYCQEEIRLNQRLASELYLGIVPITVQEGGLRVGGTGKPIEYAVQMRQFDARDELPARLSHDEVTLAEIRELGDALARFHAEASVAAQHCEESLAQRMCVAVLGNFAQLVRQVTNDQDARAVCHLMDWTEVKAQKLAELFRCRVHDGFIRECHGDLHAGNIVRFHDRLVPFDCIEFDPQLRWVDVINDIAFLVMDLCAYTRSDLAFALLSRYLEGTGDYAGVSLLHFYAVHRALVRAKVDAIIAQQNPERASQCQERMHRRIQAAMQWSTATRAPALVLMHGLSGSGKSWLSERLIPALPALRVRSDLERKRTARSQQHVPPPRTAVENMYSVAWSRRTYDRLAQCAESCLRAGVNCIVDATFLDWAERSLFQNLAERLRARYLIVSCEADPGTLARRIVERSRAHMDASDADLIVLNSQMRRTAPFALQERAHVLTIETTHPQAVERVQAVLDRM